uniref:Uncharacterized protein n=1 Tax=Glossina pallidipes TaxID=7398 RepID=A0A1B0A9Y4_GLOPL
MSIGAEMIYNNAANEKYNNVMKCIMCEVNTFLIDMSWDLITELSIQNIFTEFKETYVFDGPFYTNKASVCRGISKQLYLFPLLDSGSICQNFKINNVLKFLQNIPELTMNTLYGVVSQPQADGNNSRAEEF